MVRAAALILAAFFATPATAQDANAATKELLTHTLVTGLTTEEGRSDLVEGVKGYCAALDRAWPSNSPRENDWLDRELSGGGERILRTLESAEFARRSGRAFIERCNTWSSALADLPSLRNYAGLAYALVSFAGDAEYYGQRAGVDVVGFSLDLAPRVAAEALLAASLME